MPNNKYETDKYGLQTLKTKDGVYQKVGSKDYRYKPHGSNDWLTIKDPKSIEAIHKLDSRFKGDTTIEPPLRIQSKGYSKPTLPQGNPQPIQITTTTPTNSKASKFDSLKKGFNSPETTYNLSRAKDVTTDAALVASQYAIGKRTMNQLKDVKIPEAQQQSYIQGQRVNLDTDRGVNNTALATNLAIGKRSLSDANVAAAMRGSATANYTQQGATINQTERNANAELGQQANMVNSEIQRNNQKNIQDKNMMEMQKQDALIKGNQLVDMEALHGVQGVIAGEGARQKDRNQLAIDSATLGSPYYKRLANTMSGTTGYALKKSIDSNDNLEGQPLSIRKNGGKIAKSKVSTKLSNIYK